MKNFVKLNSRYISLLFAFSNCLVGCALGFYYGEVSAKTVIVALSIILAGIGIQALCNYSISYSRASQKHRQEKKQGIIAPIMIGGLSLTALRKRMAVVTLLTAIFGGISIFLAMGSNIQTLSWFIFISVVCLLLTSVFSINTENIYENISAHVIFFFFSFASVIGTQLLILCASHYVVDLYPDTIFISLSAGISSLMVLFVRSLRTKFRYHKLFRYKLAKFIKYELSTVYIIGLFVGYVILSVTACITSHKAIEVVFIVAGYIPMIYLIYKIVKFKDTNNRLKLRLEQLMACCCINNFVWILILIADYCLYL